MPYYVYKTQAGDTLSQIAANWLGDATLYTTILDGSGVPVANPDLILVDQLLVIPRLDKYFEYTVQAGDTLEAVALRFMGKANLGNLLTDTTEGQPLNSPLLTVGQVVRVPKDARMPSYELIPHVLANKTYVTQNGNINLINGDHTFFNDALNGITTTSLSQFVYGNLNNHGADDAAVIITTETENTTGRFAQLFALSNIQPSPLEFTNLGADLGDRVDIDEFFIEGHLKIYLKTTRGWPDATLVDRHFSIFSDAQATGVQEIV